MRTHASRTGPDGSGPVDGRVADLHGRLRSLSRDPLGADEAVTTCLVWVAGVLVEIAEDVTDARSARELRDEASAVLASVPGPAPVADRPAREALTDRQLAVLHALQHEVPLRQIADGMYVSYNTVKSHTRAVYRKLGARSRAEAVDRGRELGLM
ncbi:LuxR C-terminal-related transcriptional regulator [Streptomyces sp. NPDC046939]|uniref:helix-turn-helix transcriptional regulator n=1 Tax=Streptomyces sp. NPDC046939 TaxID=3155376 RepID=UPI0033C11C93